MNYADMDEETKAKRKKEQVEFRTKKRNSFNFMLLSSLFEIVETVLIMFLMFVIAAFVIFKVFKATGPTGQLVFQIILVAIFLGGLVIGFLVYKKCIRWVIKKFNMEDKLNDDILIHYFKDEELKNRKEQLKR